MEAVLMELNENYYTDNFDTFDEWFELILNEEKVYPQFRIPFEEWFQNYLASVGNKSIDEVKTLLRCLLVPINRKLDLSEYESYLYLKNSEDTKAQERAKNLYFNEQYKRMEAGYYAWEGITWILELLPYSPYQAVVALEGYAYSQDGLPDDRIIGLQQCINIINSRFIYLEKPNRNLFKLKPVEFEWLIEELYSKMGYDTKWTPATRDGGKDVIASIIRPDGIEHVYVECKLYNTTELNNLHVKSFAYTVNNDKINRGVIFCTGYANKALKGIDKRITILTYENICVLLNSHLGSDWDERLDNIVDLKRKKYNK